MADIKVTSTKIDGLYIIEPIPFLDDRGSLCEMYNEKVFGLYGMRGRFVQDNESTNKKNVLRGMHVNINNPQTKLIRVLDGQILDTVIDLRRDSKTYLLCFSVVLSDVNNKQLYIPDGMGHGYLSLTDSRVLFKTSTHYNPSDEIGFAWNSNEIKVDWGITNPILNERDKKNKILSEVLL